MQSQESDRFVAPALSVDVRRHVSTMRFSPWPMNRWNIPKWLEDLVIERDRVCVYCRVDFAQRTSDRRAKPSWEHIVNDAKIITLQNIARCCVGCNASKGAKNISVWFQSEYCTTRGIGPNSVAQVVRDFVSAKEPTGMSPNNPLDRLRP